MKHLFYILPLLFFQLSFGQIRVGCYSNNDTSHFVTLKLFADSTYDFYYTKGHCSGWGHYKGEWKKNKDTLILNYTNSWTEEYYSIVTEPNFNNDSVYIKFKYDDGSPISNIPVNISCDMNKYTKTYSSDSNGQVVIPYNGEIVDFYNKKCSLLESYIHFKIQNEFVGLYTSSTALNYFIGSPFSSKFSIIFKKKRKSYDEVISKKFIVRKEKIYEIKSKHLNTHYLVKSWGNFKFEK